MNFLRTATCNVQSANCKVQSGAILKRDSMATLGMEAMRATMLSIGTYFYPLRRLDDAADLLWAIFKYPAGLPNRVSKVKNAMSNADATDGLVQLMDRLGTMPAVKQLVEKASPGRWDGAGHRSRALRRVQRAFDIGRLPRGHCRPSQPPSTEHACSIWREWFSSQRDTVPEAVHGLQGEALCLLCGGRHLDPQRVPAVLR